MRGVVPNAKSQYHPSMNNVVYIILDSCRYDSFCKAKTPNISRLGTVERRYTFASWTLPSHSAFLMGISPHKNPRGVFASEVYKKDFLNWATRTGIEGVTFGDFVPQLSLPAFLKDKGFETNALFSMPVLNPMTILNNHFDRYELMDRHDDFETMIGMMRFRKDKPSFYILNVGETHYPFTIARDSSFSAPQLHGDKGIFRHSSDGGLDVETASPEQLFDLDALGKLHQRQTHCVEHVDKLFGRLFDICPPNTHFVVTADHGELFGEAGYFGHGPVFHEKVFEVFFVEGKRP